MTTNLHPDSLDDFFSDAATSLPTLMSDFADTLAANGLHFEGRPYPVSLKPFVLTGHRAEQIREAVEGLHALFDLVIAAYRTEKWVRELFPAYRTAEPLLRRWVAPPAPLICRFDGVLDTTGTFKVFETNTASPGGVIQTGMATRLWLHTAQQLGIHPDARMIKRQPLVDDPDLFGRTVIECHTRIAGKAPQAAAIVNLKGRFTNEVEWMCKTLERLDVPVQLADARSIRRDIHRRPRRDGHEVLDVVYNKLSPKAVITEPDAIDYLAAGADNALTFLNPLTAQCVLEDKAVLAVFTDPRFSGALDAAQRDLIERHVPWTRLLRPGTTIDWQGSRVDLPSTAAANRRDLVLKPVNLTRGEAVMVGCETEPGIWRTAVANAVATSDHVVQRYVELPSIHVPTTDDGLAHMVHGIDAFVFAGQLVGFHCRASQDAVVNIGSRGTLLPVVVVDQ